MKYEEGKKKLQYRCKNCKTISPHNGSCFRCGCKVKTQEVIGEIVPKRNKGQGINVSVR